MGQVNPYRPGVHPTVCSHDTAEHRERIAKPDAFPGRFLTSIYDSCILHFAIMAVALPRPRARHRPEDERSSTTASDLIDDQHRGPHASRLADRPLESRASRSGRIAPGAPPGLTPDGRVQLCAPSVQPPAPPPPGDAASAPAPASTSTPAPAAPEVQTCARSNLITTRIRFWAPVDVAQFWRHVLAACRAAEGDHLQDWECVAKMLESFRRTWEFRGSPAHSAVERYVEDVVWQAARDAAAPGAGEVSGDDGARSAATTPASLHPAGRGW